MLTSRWTSSRVYGLPTVCRLLCSLHIRQRQHANSQTNKTLSTTQPLAVFESSNNECHRSMQLLDKNILGPCVRKARPGHLVARSLEHLFDLRSSRSRSSKQAANRTPTMVFQAKELSSDLQYVSDSIRMVPDFPKKGIMFQDITTLTRDPKALKLCIEAFASRYRGQGIDIIAGIEARGFIFGPPLALALSVGFVPLRKPGKLPGETIGAEYQLEYGSDRIEMTVESIKKGQKVVIIDDLIATGGTLGAAVQLVQKVGANVHEAACVIELPELNARAKLKATGIPLFVLLEKEA